MIEDVIIVDIIGEVVASMTVSGISNINYYAGRNVNILQELIEKDNSTSNKDKKYPLIALTMPIREKRGSGFYCLATLPRIVIATLSNGTDDVLKRYEAAGTYKSTLYPCYREFLFRLAQHPNVNYTDPENFIHTKMDNPGNQPAGQGTNDFIDSLEILNLEIPLIQIKTC